MDQETFPEPAEREASVSTALYEGCLLGQSHTGRPSHTALSSAESHAGAALVSLPGPVHNTGLCFAGQQLPCTVHLCQSGDFSEHGQKQIAHLIIPSRCNALSVLNPGNRDMLRHTPQGS